MRIIGKGRSEIVNSISNRLNIPLGTLENMARLEFVSNREISIENYSAVLEYDDNLVKVEAYKIIISFWGKNLTIKHITDDSMVICGVISSVEFEERGNLKK